MCWVGILTLGVDQDLDILREETDMCTARVLPFWRILMHEDMFDECKRE
jgi:hypothetical protein